MPLTPGTTLGPYEVLAAIGAGGMGEVYKARDTKLDRDVALKILPDAFVNDPERLARFQREAKVLASLNHPNIAAIHGLEESGDSPALVLEYVPGPTLQDRIAKGPIPLDEALPIARQIAEALEAAHEQGIIHRDLKPANVKVKDDGTVKVLDFGLAKALGPELSDLDAANSPTMTMTAAVTKMGVIMGTAGYMSPEQARGKTVDKRADIWAFGVVFYEMLTGTPPFQGEDITLTLAKVVQSDPAWVSLPAGLSPALVTFLRRCLEKDAKQRIRDIGDVRLAMEGAFETTAPPASYGFGDARSRGRWLRLLPWALALIASAISLFLLVQPRQTASSGATVRRVELGMPQGVQLFTLGGRSIGMSPDGSRLAFIGIVGVVRQVYVRQLDRFEAVPLRGTEHAIQCCMFSADGRSIGFVTADASLKKVSVADGLVATIAANVEYGGFAWGSDDSVIFVRSGELWKVASSGGEPTPLTRPDPDGAASRHAWPTALPGSTAILFASTDSSGEAWQIESLVPATGERHTVVERGTLPLYAPSGHLIFYRDGALLAAPFDVETQRVTGATVRVLESLPQTGFGVPAVDVSAAGVLAYMPTAAAARLVWVSRQGAEQTLTDTPRNYEHPRLDSDGRRVLVQAGDLWLHDLARSTFTRLTGTAFGFAYPVLTPGGARVVFKTRTGLSWLALDGSGRGDAIAETTRLDFPGSISRDGEQLLFVRLSPDTSGDIYVASLGGDAPVRPILETAAYEGSAQVSPDGRWLAYASDDSGRMEVYLAPFPEADQRWQISTQGGTQPVWNPNGREMFYRSEDKMMAVSVSAGTVPTLSEPTLLFEQPYAFGSAQTIPNYDISADGQRFVMVKEESNASRLNLIFNWFEELQARVPTGR